MMWFFNIDMAVLRSFFEASEELTACINRTATESHRGARQKGHTPADQHLVPRDKETDFPYLIISGVKLNDKINSFKKFLACINTFKYFFL